MGWTSSSSLKSSKDCMDEVRSSFRNGFTVVGGSGNWIRVINDRTDRPFVVYVRTAKDRYGYAYKEMDSSMGFYYYNATHARWLAKELAKRNLAPINRFEADWIVECERRKRFNAELKSIKVGSEITSIEPFSTTDGRDFKVGHKFYVTKVSRGCFHCQESPLDGYWHKGYRLETSLFFKPQGDLLPVAV